ncbi:MAG: protein kinase [Acidobacteriota bacterium]
MKDQRLGRYVLEKELGRGGMGVVWRAFDERLGRPVALKVIGDRFAGSADGLDRFVGEARLLASLNHPNLAVVFDLLGHDDGPILVMELLDGEDLSTHLERGPLDVLQTLRLGEQVASGLAAAHGRGIVHRDLKPANVRLLSSGDVKVMDFGLAQTWTTAPEEGQGAELAGTPAYMSPEQARCEALDGRSDLFTLGLVLLECLVQKRALRDDETEQRFTATHRRIDLASLSDEVPASLRELLRSCLAEDREARPQSALELRERLRAEHLQLDSGAKPKSTERRPRLPLELDTFVGREDELAELSRRLGTDSTARLLTVLGPGGMGKTRLVVHHAWSHRVDYPGGAVFCDLSEARDDGGIARAVATALGVSLGPGDPIEQLGHVIEGHGPCLVVLDNFEQVVEHAAATVGRWLQQAARARFVVTSREALNVPGEQVLAIDSLPSEGALELLALRARSRRPDFVVSDESRPLLEELVRLLDGLPLAIELAAARARVLSPAQLLERVSDRFELLRGGRGATGRQATLRATLDWSWELLEPWEQAALAQLSVFEGAFSLEAAEAVLDLSAWEDAPWALDVVQALVDRSLLRSWSREIEPAGSTTAGSFGFYVSVHDYAAAKLAEDGAVEESGSGAEAERRAVARHGRHFARFGSDEAVQALTRHGGAESRRSLGLDLENLVAACERAIRHDDGEIAVATFLAAWAVLEVRGPFATACVLGPEVLELESLSPRRRLSASMTLGIALLQEGRLNDARHRLDQALALAQELDEERTEGLVRGRLAVLEQREGRFDDAMAQLTQALALHRRCGHRWAEGAALGNLGGVLGDLAGVDAAGDDLAEAQSCFEEALVIAREVGDRRLEGVQLMNLGLAFGRAEGSDAAVAHYEQALVLFREAGDRRLEGLLLRNIGLMHLSAKRWSETRQALAEAEVMLREVGHREGVVMALVDGGITESMAGDRAAALVFLERAREQAERLGVREGSVLSGSLARLEGMVEEGGSGEA